MSSQSPREIMSLSKHSGQPIEVGRGLISYFKMMETINGNVRAKMGCIRPELSFDLYGSVSGREGAEILVSSPIQDCSQNYNPAFSWGQTLTASLP
jgi:hypothetical protein